MAATNRTKRLFLVLWVAGMAGVLSLLLLDLEALIAMVPAEYAPKDGLPPWPLLKLASVVQPAILTTVAVIVGVLLSPKVGLRSPLAEAFAERGNIVAALRPQIFPGIVSGLLGGAAIVGSWLLARPYINDEFGARSEAFNKLIPPAMRFLYGGLTEEVLLRWGLMTFLVWFIWRVTRRGAERPASWIFVAGIILSAVIFGIGHLPVASMLAGGLTLPLTAYVIGANSLFGIFAGSLYWKRGLESAMIAHIFAHVVLLSAVKLAF